MNLKESQQDMMSNCVSLREKSNHTRNSKKSTAPTGNFNKDFSRDSVLKY